MKEREDTGVEETKKGLQLPRPRIKSFLVFYPNYVWLVVYILFFLRNSQLWWKNVKVYSFVYQKYQIENINMIFIKPLWPSGVFLYIYVCVLTSQNAAWITKAGLKLPEAYSVVFVWEWHFVVMRKWYFFRERNGTTMGVFYFIYWDQF